MNLNMASGKFSIDDAFQSDEEDPIRVYGAFNERENAHLAPNEKPDNRPRTTSTAVQHKNYRSVPILGKEYPELANSVHSDGSNEITDTSIGLLSGQVEGHSIYRTSSAYSFGSSCSASLSAKNYTDRRWWKHPKVRENWKIVIAAVVLLVLGLALFIAGIVIEISQTKVIHSFVFFIAGTICLIPGAYHVVYIYCAVKGRKGFSFYNLPVFK